RPDADAEPDETVRLPLSKPACAALGARAKTTVRLSDDDRPLQLPPSFTIGGTVSGLRGTGLVLDNLGTRLPVSDGGFVFPTRVADHLPYDVRIATQPSNPDQVCTIARGTVAVAGANVSDIAVVCAPPTP